jgi:hypothetical protein
MSGFEFDVLFILILAGLVSIGIVAQYFWRSTEDWRWERQIRRRGW